MTTGTTGTIQQQPQHVTVIASGGGGPPAGAPAGGHWIEDRYCGLITWIIGIFLLPCVCCCPCDTRTVYQANGVKYNPQGAVVSDDCC